MAAPLLVRGRVARQKLVERDTEIVRNELQPVYRGRGYVPVTNGGVANAKVPFQPRNADAPFFAKPGDIGEDHKKTSLLFRGI